MSDIRELMIELDGADLDTVNRIAWEKGSLPVRLAMLGLAAIRKGASPLWWGYPPGVFISYKWDGAPMHDLVRDLAAHLRKRGYRAFLDVENLDAEADAYFQIPRFIASLQECTYYVLLLTERSADLITARKGKTSWIHDEHRHAVRLTNLGRLIIVPVLLESAGATDLYTLDKVLDLTDDRRAFDRLDDVLPPDPIVLAEPEIGQLAAIVARFDELFLGQQWDASADLLRSADHLGQTFDHRFRRMLHALYTADEAGFRTAFDELATVYGQQVVYHLYKGYCNRHEIPKRMSMD